MRHRTASTEAQRLEAELAALRAENARLRRRLARARDGEAPPVSRVPAPQRAAHVRSMLRDRASRNP